MRQPSEKVRFFDPEACADRAPTFAVKAEPDAGCDSEKAPMDSPDGLRKEDRGWELRAA